jgi:hypothetical protein
MKTQIYDGNGLFKVNCNLYGYEDLNHAETLEAIRQGFEDNFKADLITALDEIGLKFIGFKTFSPAFYNFDGDSIDLEIGIIDVKKYINAVAKNETAINELLKANKSYDGYMARTVLSTVEEIKDAKEDPDFTPDIIPLSYLLSKKIDFAGGIDIGDYFIYDYECMNDDCKNERENLDDELCPSCQAKEDLKNKE